MRKTNEEQPFFIPAHEAHAALDDLFPAPPDQGAIPVECMSTEGSGAITTRFVSKDAKVVAELGLTVKTVDSKRPFMLFPWLVKTINKVQQRLMRS